MHSRHQEILRKSFFTLTILFIDRYRVKVTVTRSESSGCYDIEKTAISSSTQNMNQINRLL